MSHCIVRSFGDMDRMIVWNLHLIRQLSFDVIVYIPRSGAAPAGMLATYLNKPFASVEEYCRGMICTRKAIDYDKRMRRILLVDDHHNRGLQLRKYVKQIKKARRDVQITTLCVFGSDRDKEFPCDVVLENTGDDYVFPWFAWKSKHALNDVLVDMDGVLCRDCTREENDDGERYQEFLETAEPKFLPHADARLQIVTSRNEKYRAQTQAWLQQHGIGVAQLVMGKWRDLADQKKRATAWKVEQYKKSDARLFIESNDSVARRIYGSTSRPVYCVDSSTYYG